MSISTKCTVCRREDVAAINDALRAGRPLTAIAAVFDVSKSAAHRHADHVPPKPPQRRSSPAPTPAPDAAVPPPPALPPPRLDTTDAMIHELTVAARGQIVRLASDESLSVSERSKLQSAAVQTLTLLAKLEGRTELSERRILASPALRRVERGLVEALRPWPDALRAAEEALERLGSEGDASR